MASPVVRPPGPSELRDHLANERTFLAWIRTAVTIMALGFLVARSGPVVEAISRKGTHALVTSTVAIGVTIILAGVLTALLATFRFLQVRRDINHSVVRFSATLDLVLAGIIFLLGLTVAVYIVVEG